MKSKRRHELQTNDLADRIGHIIERIRPYATTVLAVLVAFAVVISVWYYLAVTHERKLANAWRAYFSAGTDPQADITTQLSEVADSYSDTAAGLWAAQTAADFELAQGVRLMFSDRAEAETNIEKAKELYGQVLNSKLAKSYPMLLERASFGMAQAYESLSQLDEAKKYYEMAAKANPGSPLAEAAQKRLKKLADPDVDKWYNWFARQEPAPPQPPSQASPSLGSGSPLGPGLPSLTDLPDTPDSKASGSNESKSKNKSNSSKSEPAAKDKTTSSSSTPQKTAAGSTAPKSKGNAAGKKK